MAKNEDLMAEIQAAAMEDYNEMEGQMEGLGGGEIEENDDKERLRTIGEDGDEEKQHETKQDHRKAEQQPQQLMEDEDYEQDYEEKEDGEDYEF